MNIPESITKKYNISTYGEYVHDNESLEEYCRLILKVTDYIPNEILEGAATSADYADELYYREVARQELDKLNGGTGEAAQVLPLDASIEKAGANIDYIAMMADIELPEMEV